MTFRRSVLVPTLLALAAPFAVAGDAVSSEVARDAQFSTVRKLIGEGIKLPGDRQVKAFAAANHPDPDGWYAKTLRWYWLDQFRSTLTGPNVADLIKEADSLQKLLEDNRAKLPAEAQSLLSAASGLLRQVNDAGVVNPTLPPPIGGPDGWAPETKAKTVRAIEQVIKIGSAEVDAKFAEVLAYYKSQEKKLEEVDNESKDYQTIAQKCALMWDDALKSFSIMHITLREVVTRGKEWGLDKGPAEAALQSLTKKHIKSVTDADFLWGEMYPPLRHRVAVFLGEASRYKMKTAAVGDVDEAFQSVFKIKPADFRDAANRNFMVVVQFDAWADAIKWCIDLGDDKSLKRGLEYWRQYQEGYKDDPDARLDGKDLRKSGAAAKVWIAAARLLDATGDTPGALNALGAVGAAKDNQYRGNAGAWISYLTSRNGNKGGDYDRAAVPTDPGAALATAKALLSESLKTSDADQARKFGLMAVATLRNGVAGLGSSEPAAWNEFGPQLYDRLVFAFSNLKMPLQAQATAIEGLRRIIARGGAAGTKGNPWRAKGDEKAPGKFTELGVQTVQTLVRRSISMSLNASSDYRMGAIQNLNADIIDLAQKISPEDTGDNLLIMEIANRFANARSNEEYDAALKTADEKGKSRPDLANKVFGVVSNGLQRWFDKLDKDGNAAKRDEVGALLSKRADERRKIIAPLLAQATPPREALRDQSMIESVSQFIALRQGKFKEVMEKLAPMLLKAPPTDDDVAATALRDLCTATARFYEAEIKDAAAQQDAKRLLANWPLLDRSYAAYAKLKPRLTQQQQRVEIAGGNLAFVFNSVQTQAAWMGKNPQVALKGLSAEETTRISEIEKKAKRAFADLYEPRLGAKSKPNEVWAVAAILWDIGEHARSVRLYELFRSVLATSKELQTFQAAPKAWLDGKESLFASRQELRDGWVRIRDLLEDKRSIKELWDQGQPLSSFGEQPVNYNKAVGAAREFRAKVEGLKDKLGSDLYGQYKASMDDLDATVMALYQDVASKGKLAAAYREAGRKTEAQAMFNALFDYDPYDPDFSAAYVELVIDRVKNPGGEANGAVPADQLKKARSIAVDNRERTTPGTEDFWIAVIQVVELSAAIGDKDSINARLRWIQVNKSDLTRDLIKSPVEQGGLSDDPRARRPRNVQAVELAKRFLEIYQVPGVEYKPTYRIDQIDENGTAVPLFVNADAPEFENLDLTDRDGEPVRILWEKGKPAPTPKELPKPEPVGPASGAIPAAAGSTTAASK